MSAPLFGRASRNLAANEFTMRRACAVCGERIADNKLALASHAKTHVRAGTARAETRTLYGMRRGAVVPTGRATSYFIA